MEYVKCSNHCSNEVQNDVWLDVGMVNDNISTMSIKNGLGAAPVIAKRITFTDPTRFGGEKTLAHRTMNNEIAICPKHVTAEIIWGSGKSQPFKS